jgi:prepilin-type N-terminal cleavage/methylation domain-containing protein
MKANLRNKQAGFTLIEYIVGLVIAGIVAAMVYTFFGTALTQSGVPLLRLQKEADLAKVMENITEDYNRLNNINLRYRWQASTPYSLDTIVTPKTIPANPNGGHYYQCTNAGTSSTTEPSWPITNGESVTDGGVIWKESGNIIWQASHAYSVGNLVLPINNTGHYYRCTTAGTSKVTEPIWPTSTGGTVTETGGPTWTEAGTILESAYLTDLKDYLATPSRYGTGYTVVENKYIQFNGTTEVDAGTSGTSSEKSNLKVTIKDNESAETLTGIFTIR